MGEPTRARGGPAAGEDSVDGGKRGSAIRPWLAGVAVLAVLAAGAGVAHRYLFPGAESRAEPQAAPQAPPPVTVSPPLQRHIVEMDEYTGQFAPIEHVEVRARVSGYLKSVHFSDGEMVRKGDLLFVIDPRPFEIALASAKAQLAEATARYELASRQVSRASRLREKDFVAESTYDERAAEARVAAAAVSVAEAAVAAAELDLEYTRITAPVSGRASRHEVDVGNLVSGGAGEATTLLTTIVSLDPIHFVFDLSEMDFLAYQRAVAEGRLRSTRDDHVKVRARLFDQTDWPYEGHLDFVDNQVDRGAGTIRMRAIFPNRDLLITPGQFGRLRLPGSEPYDALLVPESAIVTDQSRTLVMTVAPDGTVAPKLVRVGPTYDGLKIIRKGLTADDRVVINGLMRALPGAKVTPMPGEIKSAGEAHPG